MKKTLLITHAIFISFFIHAQSNFQWAHNYGTEFQTQGHGVALDVSGNVYTIGDYKGELDADPGANELILSAPMVKNSYITKMDAFGNLIWAKDLGGDEYPLNLKAISVDATGNVILTGNLQGTMDLDPGAAEQISSSSAVVFIVKLNTDGEFVWGKSFDSAPGSCNVASIQTDANGNVYIAGEHSDAIDFDPGLGTYILDAPQGLSFNALFIVKLDMDGVFVWAGHTEYPPASSQVYVDCADLEIDESGNAYSTGYITGNADFDPTAGEHLLPVITSGAFILKWDSNGLFEWVHVFGGNSSNSGRGIDSGTNGDVYITGSFGPNTDFDPDPDTEIILNPIGNSYNDSFILKLDSSGNLIWVKTMGASTYDFGYDIALDATENVYTIGTFENTVDFDTEAGIFEMTPAGPQGLYITAHNSEGTFMWSRQIGGPTTSYTSQELTLSIAVDAQSNIYSVGSFNQVADFDSGDGVFELNSGDDYDAFILKMGQNANSILAYSAPHGLTLYPNPAHDKIHLSFLVEHSTDAIYRILDLSGKTIHTTGKLKTAGGIINETIHIPLLEPGCYILVVSFDGEIYGQKLLIE